MVGVGCCPIGVMAGILLRSVVCLRCTLARVSPNDWEWLCIKLPEYRDGVVVPVVAELDGGFGDLSSS